MEMLAYLATQLIKPDPDNDFVQPLKEEVRLSLAESFLKIIHRTQALDAAIGILNIF